MTRLNRFLDWLDEAAGGLIRIAYLAWGVVAVAAYFSDTGAVPHSVTATLDAIAPWVLGFAVETHSYLSARRMRAAFQGMQNAPKDSDAWLKSRQTLFVNLGVLLFLLAFSVFNQLQYLGETWTPPTTKLAIPGIVAYFVRALVVPAAFVAAALLAPMGESLAMHLQDESRHFAMAAFQVARRQWHKRLKEMERNDQDVTGVLVNLVGDGPERHFLTAMHSVIVPGSAFKQVLVAGSRKPGAALPDPQQNRRMHDGDLGDNDDTSDAYREYDEWETLGSWQGPGDRLDGSPRDHRPGRARADAAPDGRDGRDMDHDPFGSGMYRPDLGNYGQSAPNSRAARQTHQAQRNGHPNGNGHRNGGGNNNNSIGAAIQPTSYTTSASAPTAPPASRSYAAWPPAESRSKGKRPKSQRWDAGKTREEISRVVAERDTDARRILDACDGQIGQNALARQLANLGHRASTRDAREYIREWGAAHGYHHLHLGNYPVVPPAAPDANMQDGHIGIPDEVDHDLLEAEDYSTWALPSEAVQQMSDAARHAWRQQQAEHDDLDAGLA